MRDLSRDAEDYGTEVRIARERDTASTLFLPSVPFAPRYRLQLRIYDIDGRAGGVGIHGGRSSGTAGPCPLRRSSWAHATKRETPCNSNQPAYVSVDLNQVLAKLAGTGLQRVWIEATGSSRRLWAFVTVTNNATQRVTVISPQ